MKRSELYRIANPSVLGSVPFLATNLSRDNIQHQRVKQL